MTAIRQTQPKPDSPLRPNFTAVRSGLLQRKCACGGTPGPTGECEECRRKRLQRKASQPSTFNSQPAEVPPIVHEVLGSPGQPLDPATRAFMEPRFGHEFSRVRVHTDARAAESARAVNALAYTAGESVAFSAGQYAPGTSRGRELLAHELTHVIQQSDVLSSDGHLAPGPVDDAQEHEANRIESSMLQQPAQSDRLVQGLVPGRTEVSLQRTPTDAQTGTETQKTPYVAPDSKRFNFCFIMGEAGAYYKLGDYYAKTYYSGSHKIIHAASLCGILGEIRKLADVFSAGEQRQGIGEVIIISHADNEGRFYFPLNDGDTTRWVTPDDIAQVLSPDWLEKTGIGCRTDALRVAAIADASTRVIVKGCNLGQNQAAVDALRQLFGDKATVTAPKLKVELAVTPLGGETPGRRNPSEVITWMVNNQYLPPDAEQWPADKKEHYFRSLLENNDVSGITGIPMDYLLLPGPGAETTRIPPSDPRYQENLAVSQSSQQ